MASQLGSAWRASCWTASRTARPLAVIVCVTSPCCCGHWVTSRSSQSSACASCEPQPPLGARRCGSARVLPALARPLAVRSAAAAHAVSRCRTAHLSDTTSSPWCASSHSSVALAESWAQGGVRHAGRGIQVRCSGGQRAGPQGRMLLHSGAGQPDDLSGGPQVHALAAGRVVRTRSIGDHRPHPAQVVHGGGCRQHRHGLRPPAAYAQETSRRSKLRQLPPRRRVRRHGCAPTAVGSAAQTQPQLARRATPRCAARAGDMAQASDRRMLDVSK